MTDEAEDELLQTHTRVMGPALGPIYNGLFSETAWLDAKWQQFLGLYGTKPQRIDLVNRAAGFFFRVVQDAIAHDVLLGLTRLTDPSEQFGHSNLTILALPALISDDTLRGKTEGLIAKALEATDFARDWRNRKLAHNDLDLGLGNSARPLQAASVNKVNDALSEVWRVIQVVNDFYFHGELQPGPLMAGGEVSRLVRVLYEGLQAEDRRQKERRGVADPYKPPPPDL